jgi:uncharacterized radical SAM superfamily protein
MSKLSAESIWRMNERQLLNVLKRDGCGARRKRIRFYAPSFMYYKTSHYASSSSDFPTISITGNSCALRCKHCGGTVLNTMYPATSPDTLLRLCTELKEKGARGCLISGGCLPNGTVPLGRFVESIAKIKQQLGLTVFVHTGVIDLETAEGLKKAGVDAALLDIIGSNETIKEIFNLEASVSDYANSLKALHEAGIEFVPHVIVGLHHGKLQGELLALRTVSEFNPSALVIIAFMPIRGTQMENVKPPRPIDIARVIAAARLMFPDTALALGCMRSKNEQRSETEKLAIEAGVDAIAFPTEEAVEFAESQGCETSFSSFCCSQIYLDMRTSATSGGGQQLP